MKVYCDGGCHCHGPDKIGGWAIVLEDGTTDSGAEPNTTSQRMELEAAIRAIRATAAYEHVEVITDSQYVVKGMNEWMIGWKKREWKNVKNVDLWLELDKAAASRNVTWTWTRGHNGDPLNEECDRLNQEAIRNFA